MATAAGTVQFEHRYRPVRVRRAERWVPVDTTLQVRADGAVAPKASAVDVTFSGGGAAPMASVAHGGKTVSFGSPVGALPSPQLAGSTATYPEVLPGVDLQLRADVDGFAQILMVKTRDAAANPKLARLTFGVSGKGLSGSVDKGHNLRFTDAAGELVLSGNTPLMWDGEGAPAGGNRPGRRTTMPTTLQGTTLTVTPDAAMLRDPATMFPLSIDPGVTANRSSWAQVDSGTATTAYWNSASDAEVGTANAGASKKRAFFNMDLAGTPVAGKYVSAASLQLTETYAGSCTARQVDLYATGAATSTTTWNAQPAWNTLQSSATVAKGFDTSCPAGTVNMDATTAVRSAADSSAATVTLGLRSPDETDNSYFKRFSNNPTLAITYTAYPTIAAQATSPSTPCVTGSTRPYINTVTPLLQARIMDAEGALVRPEFEWYTVGGARIGGVQPTPGQASGHLFATTVPAGAMGNTGSYSWRVRGFDGVTWGPWSGSCEFTVDITAPSAAPTVSSTTYPAATWAGATGTAGTFTLGAASVSDVAAYLYGLDSDPNTVVNAAALGGTASVSITPTSDGPHTLKVQSRDRGGNLSAVTTYVFNVGTGAVTAPKTGDLTAGKVTLSGLSKTTSTGITYQWRRGDADTWVTIPSGDVTTTGGSAITWPVASTGSGAYPNLVWNVGQTVNNAEAGPDALDGPVQVRASLSGTSSGTTSGATFALDRNKASAASAEVGPGLVNLLTGAYTIDASDVSSGGLSLQRSFNSRRASDTDPMFGPGWTASIGVPNSGAYTELTVTGSLVQLGQADASTLNFAKKATTSSGADFTAEVGAQDNKLTYTSTGDTYTLTEASGSVVTFTRRSGDPTGFYTPTSMVAAGTTKGSSISWEKVTIGTTDVVRPTRVLAAVPDGVTCGATLVQGCRALSFTYATSTTATGTTSSTLGDYLGRLKTVSLTAWDPDLATPAMRTITLGQYSYDNTGRLRAAWDPRLDYTNVHGTQRVTTAYTYNTNGTLATLTPPGQETWQFTYTTIPGDAGTGRIYKVTRSALSAGTSVQSIVYNVPISGSSAPVDMAANIARWGQSDVPVDATSVYPPNIIPDGDPATGQLPSWAGDDRVTVTYMDANGQRVNTMDPGGFVSASWHNANGTVRELSARNLERALWTSSTDTTAQEAALAKKWSTEYLYSDDGLRLLEKFEPEQEIVLPDWSNVRGRPHTTYAYDQGAPTTGGPYNLVTAETRTLQYVLSGATVDVDKRVTTRQYDWSLRQATVTTVDPDGLALTTRTTYDSSTGLPVSTTTPAGDAGGTTPATRKTIYYRAGTGSGFSDCDTKPHWAMLECRTYAAAQPATGAEIPATVNTYNLYGQPRTVTTKSSTTTLRTVTISYDAAGRSHEATTTSSLGTATSKVRAVYDPATGNETGTQLVDGAGTVTASLTRAYDTLGRRTSYTDADGNTTTATYDLHSRPLTITDNKGAQSLSYNGGDELRGLPTQVVDSQGGTFVADYDADGHVITETRPDGLTVKRYYNEAAQPTGIEYLTNSSCTTTSCTLYYDYEGRDVHGKTRWDSSSFSNAGYGYDQSGRITDARQDTPSCTLRDYKFDTATNRTKLTTYNPGSSGECQDTNQATARAWTYDTADRVTITGYSYDSLGRTLTMPDDDTRDGDGSGDLQFSYYTNDMIRKITTPTTEQVYNLDVTGDRFRSYQTTSGAVIKSMTHHYGDDSDQPTWIDEGGWYTRTIKSFGGLAALYTGVAGHLEWKMINLHGDVVATIVAGNTGISATHTTDEFGQRTASSSSAGRYGWLGNKQRSADNPAGLITMGVRIYNPTTGRFLSKDALYGGNANSYDYCSGDPVNCSDTSGLYSIWYRSCAKSWGTRIETTWTHGIDINIRCDLGHGWMWSAGAIKSGIGGALGAALGAWLGNVPGAVIGTIVGFIVGIGLSAWYSIYCTRNDGAQIKGMYKRRYANAFRSGPYWHWGYPQGASCH